MRIKTEREPAGLGLKRIRGRLQTIWDLAPEMGSAIDAAQTAIYTAGTLSPRLRELLRLRIAFHNQCRTCMAVRYAPGSVSEDLVCSLERPSEAPDLTEAERLALAYADRFATDHLSIDDAMYDGLRDHYSESEIVEIGAICAICVGVGRLTATWDVVDDLPDDYLDAGPTTPWGHSTVFAPHLGPR